MEGGGGDGPGDEATARQDHAGNFTGKARLGTPRGNTKSRIVVIGLRDGRGNYYCSAMAPWPECDTPHGGVPMRYWPQQIKCGFSQPGFA